MSRRTSLSARAGGLLAVCLLSGVSTAQAEDPAGDAPEQAAVGVAQSQDAAKPSFIRTAFARMQLPHFGWRWSTWWYPEFDLSTGFYSVWRRTEVPFADARCEPSPWAPRGYGVPKHIACHRIDYAPYLVPDEASVHLPAYYVRHPLEPCCDDGPCCKRCRRHVGIHEVEY